jgi:hypothetical protein
MLYGQCSNVAIVIPTIREEALRRFLELWRAEFEGHRVIVVEDNPQRSFEISEFAVEHYSWTEIDRELGAQRWIIPRRTDCVRSFGYYKAVQGGADAIITLDDDCYPLVNGSTMGFVEKHLLQLNSPAEESAWISSGSGVSPRGMPYLTDTRQSQCAINHGLWTRVPDLDAVTQLANGRFGHEFVPARQIVPRGKYFPMCGMNLAFRAEAAPAMYFLLMGRDWPFDRFGDIWCGIFVKKICDHLGYAVRSGDPMIEHQRASGVWTNLRKELPGYEINETLWRMVDAIVLDGRTFAECYAQLADALPFEGDYWTALRRAMHAWVELVAEANVRIESPALQSHA